MASLRSRYPAAPVKIRTIDFWVMRKVSVYCSLSGCTPESAQALVNVISANNFTQRSLVHNAVNAIISDDEKEGQEGITIIGSIGENGELSSNINGLEREIALRVPDGSLRIIPNCRMGDDWYYGYVAPPDPRSSYLLSYGTNIAVQSVSLPILYQATGGRMTPQRLWRLAMGQGFSEVRDCDLLKGIEYGEVLDGIDQYMRPTPGIEDLIELEELGDVEAIKVAIILKGKFWIWMRPDRYPFHGIGLALNPIHTEPPINYSTPTMFEQLPYELASQIAHELPLPSLLSTFSTSRWLRSKFLSLASDRDALACSWMVHNTPYYLPDEGPGSGVDEGVGWRYLQRCLCSGSMRNRKRIWQIAEQLELLADEVGI